MNESTVQREREICKIVERYYRPGEQKASKCNIYRNHVRPQYHIGRATFFRYLDIGKNNGLKI
jgi:hypothetical protein